MRGCGVIGVVCAATVVAQGALSEQATGDRRQATGDRRRAEDTGSAACGACHEAEHGEWKSSRHAAAWRDPIFQAEFAHGRAAWCVGCHAPLAPDALEVDDGDPLVAEGVGCAGCHLRDGEMVSSRRSPTSPHATRIDRSFGSADFCASCHEFNFPVLGERGVLARYTDEPMQPTVSQWRSSDLSASMTCADCHAASPAGHAFRGSHDAEMVAAAVELTLCRDRDALRADLANRGAGHNVPSGGVHRRMVLRAWRSHAPERVVEQVFGRTFRPLRGGGKQTTSDTTIPPGAAGRARFALRALGAPAGDETLNVELRYIYALDERADLAGAVPSRVIVHQRVVPSTLPRCPRS